jgi:hypothetical protein
MRIDIDDTGLTDIINRFPSRENKRAIVVSINKTITNVQTRKAKIAGAELDIVKTNGKTKSKIIKSHLSKAKANYSMMSGKSTAEGKPLEAIYFRHRPTKSGVKLRVKRNGSLRDLKHAFIATMRSGHTGIFWRKTIQGRPFDPNANYSFLPREYKLPIEELFGPRIEDILAEEYEAILRFGSDRLIVNLQAEIDRMLRGF